MAITMILERQDVQFVHHRLVLRIVQYVNTRGKIVRFVFQTMVSLEELAYFAIILLVIVLLAILQPA
jgi:hypothetical protein